MLLVPSLFSTAWKDIVWVKIFWKSSWLTFLSTEEMSLSSLIWYNFSRIPNFVWILYCLSCIISLIILKSQWLWVVSQFSLSIWGVNTCYISRITNLWFQEYLLFIQVRIHSWNCWILAVTLTYSWINCRSIISGINLGFWTSVCFFSIGIYCTGDKEGEISFCLKRWNQIYQKIVINSIKWNNMFFQAFFFCLRIFRPMKRQPMGYWSWFLIKKKAGKKRKLVYRAKSCWR